LIGLFVLEKPGSIIDSTYASSEDEIYSYNFGKHGIGFYTTHYFLKEK